MKAIRVFLSIGLFIAAALTGCGLDGGASSGLSLGGSGNVQPAGDTIEIVGAGIKGPLAFADTKVFVLDPSFPEFYDSSSPVATAMTDQYAQIAGLAVPRNIKLPFVLTIGGEQAIDLNTGKAPVVPTLITVITKEMLRGKRPVYATPLTTLAFHMARHASGTGTDTDTFLRHLTAAAAQAAAAFAIDDQHPIHVFSSPLVINSASDTLAEQEEAVYHRAAVEAFSAKVYELSKGKGYGLRANYYADRNLTQAVLERVDPRVNFNWGINSPGTGVPADGFSVRWTGLIESAYSEDYTFYASMDDGVRLWVGGQLLIDQWFDRNEAEYTGTMRLVAGEKYPIVLEYYDNTGLAVSRLLWESASQPKTVIPQESLYAVSDPGLLESITADSVIDRLALDLQSDARMDDAANGTPIGGIDPRFVQADPMKLSIPNTSAFKQYTGNRRRQA